jgi:hypothetical protein
MIAPAGGDPRTEVDRDALLCALVLAPVTFSRNRFFSLFSLPWAHRTRSRATQLRTMVRHLAAADRWRAEVRDLRLASDGGVVLRYGVPGLSLERTAMLDPLEIAVIRFALSRRPRPTPDTGDGAMLVTADDRRRVEAALAKLTPLDREPVLLGVASVPEQAEPSPSSTPPTAGES